MKVSGIICEYNPLHNGHVHHIRQTRANGATHIVGVMSGNFVQRGDTAILNKFDRAKLAVNAGVDLVIELPVAFSAASAELFATGAVSILHIPASAAFATRTKGHLGRRTLRFSRDGEPCEQPATDTDAPLAIELAGARVELTVDLTEGGHPSYEQLRDAE
jgi:hypothetical protein